MVSATGTLRRPQQAPHFLHFLRLRGVRQVLDHNSGKTHFEWVYNLVLIIAIDVNRAKDMPRLMRRSRCGGSVAERDL